MALMSIMSPASIIEPTVVYAESSLQETIEEKAQRIADEYGVPFEVMDNIITNESQWGAYRVGDRGESVGLVHIHLPSNPDITREEAENDDFSLRFLASEIKAGREYRWSICSCVAYLRIKGVKLPRVGDIKNLVPNFQIPRVGGAVKITYSNGKSHGGLVEQVTGAGIYVSQYNKPRCQYSEEFISFESGLIEGYWYEEDVPSPSS